MGHGSQSKLMVFTHCRQGAKAHGRQDTLVAHPGKPRGLLNVRSQVTGKARRQQLPDMQPQLLQG